MGGGVSWVVLAAHHRHAGHGGHSPLRSVTLLGVTVAIGVGVCKPWEPGRGGRDREWGWWGRRNWVVAHLRWTPMVAKPPRPRCKSRGGVTYRCRLRRPPGTGGKEPIYYRSTGSGPARAGGSRTGRASYRAACGRRKVAEGVPRNPTSGTTRRPPARTTCCRTPCSTCRGKKPPPDRRNRPDRRRDAIPDALREESGVWDALPVPCPISLPTGAPKPCVMPAGHAPDPPEHTTPASSLWLQS